MKEKIEILVYGYDKTQFMPIFRDGELANRNEFIVYKAKRLIAALQVGSNWAVKMLQQVNHAEDY